MEETESKRVQTVRKIRKDWGTAAHFCRKNGININTFDVVMHGNFTSKRVTDILIEHGYIKDAAELRRNREEV